MLIRHRKVIQFPDLTLIKDQATVAVIKDLCRIITDESMNILDDITNLEKVERTDTLPTASVDYLGKLMLKSNAGALDTLYQCVYNGATSTYVWKQITLS